MLIIREVICMERQKKKTRPKSAMMVLFSPLRNSQPSPANTPAPVSSELRRDEATQGRVKEGGTRSRRKRKKPNYRDRNDVCPEAPKVPETAMERRYPLCPMQKRKTHAHVAGKSCQTRLLESPLYRTCRPAAALRWLGTLAGVAAIGLGQEPLAYSTGRQMIQQKTNISKAASRSTASS
jgi:hypothetical protein